MTPAEHTPAIGFVVQLLWIEMRTGLERATSCHDHDGFQASPRQILRRSIHVDAA